MPTIQSASQAYYVRRPGCGLLLHQTCSVVRLSVNLYVVIVSCA